MSYKSTGITGTNHVSQVSMGEDKTAVGIAIKIK